MDGAQLAARSSEKGSYNVAHDKNLALRLVCYWGRVQCIRGDQAPPSRRSRRSVVCQRGTGAIQRLPTGASLLPTARRLVTVTENPERREALRRSGKMEAGSGAATERAWLVGTVHAPPRQSSAIEIRVIHGERPCRAEGQAARQGCSGHDGRRTPLATAEATEAASPRRPQFHVADFGRMT